MFTIIDNVIHITRGDIACFTVEAETTDGQYYRFQEGDVVRFRVLKRKKPVSVVLQKDFYAEPESSTVTILLHSDETKIGEMISKPTKYWYEVELNPDTAPQTIIGYDISGEKTLILYPEGGDI